MSLSPSIVGQVTGLDYKITTDLASEPIAASEAKTHMKIDYTDEDTLITSLITVARQQLEKWSGLAFGEKTVKVYMKSHRLTVDFPIVPVSAVTSVKVNAGETTEDTLTAGDHYFLRGVSDKKLDVYNHYNGLEVIYTTSALADIPFSESIKAAVKAQVAHLYEHRGDAEAAGLSPVAKSILLNHKKCDVF